MADSKLRREDENLSIRTILWECELLKTKVWIIKIGKKFWFFIKEIALALKYSDPKDPIKDLIDSEDKKTIKELLGPNFLEILKKNYQGVGKSPTPLLFRNLQPHQILTNELGLYSFCTRSRKEKAKPFQRWIFNTIAEIRETGSYNLPGGVVSNPIDLLNKVSNLEKEIQTLKKETKRTRDKETQTEKSVVILDGSFKDLEEKIVKTLKKNKSSLKRAIKQIELDLEKSIQEVKLDIRKTSSSSSSSHSSHCLYYSSDSD